MRTPAGGDRSTQWVIQWRTPPSEETAVTPWIRHPADHEYTATSSSAQTVLGHLRDNFPEREWRAIRIEVVQRVEDW